MVFRSHGRDIEEILGYPNCYSYFNLYFWRYFSDNLESPTQIADWQYTL